ncbi:Dol-P-Man:Man-PP-Dol alpha-1,3-mannosyltransferase [Erysiphe neolycopersici]|uniref:Dol-P-Man:Man(5)GlcNAc(2)-PP-Dol alpha-1,3-mannosyltransferase n=1 Tax=Erysiphe neolycopersici TaxID=212602 RepID=A0A420I2M1_9PEZI|nr:Dol-P-Man:Man-PP-Dol alpha-1,3-mannosyltransferase [Erysiphe neolycopersici]
MTKETGSPNSCLPYVRPIRDLLRGVHPWSRYAALILLLADALLCCLIISKVSYTEIDWRAYMKQIEMIVEGERDYTKIRGGTGPLVYPAAHVYLYWTLYQITNQGNNILLAQVLFGVLYIATLAIVISCYKQAEVPVYVLPMLILSKRLHSIFLLRLFNDCFAVFFLWIAIYLFQVRRQTLGSFAYSWGLGIKMSLLLSFPAIGIILFLTKGFYRSLVQILLIVQFQLIMAIPFVSSNAIGYFSKAFEISRQFNFKWTVNWRFVGDTTFLNHKFSIALLAGHLCTLILFITTRWLRPIQRPVKEVIRNFLKLQVSFHGSQHAISRRTNPNFILTTILSANSIGFLFARSMHYQFYTYIAVASPFLLWRAGLHPILQYFIWALQEWAWNVYPSTNLSSKVVVSVQLFVTFSIWWSTRNDFICLRDDTFITKKSS